MFTYRIYVDGGHHVIATYENGTLLGEATYIIRSLEAIAGTGTTVTIRRVYNQTPVFANIPFADLRKSDDTQWGNTQANTITALNALLQAAAGGGAGTITSVNANTGPAVVLFGTDINRNGSTNIKIESALISIESSVTALTGDVQTLFTIVGKPGGTKTVVKDPGETDQIEVTSATTKVNNVLLLTPTSTVPTTPPTGGMYMDLSGDLFISQSK